MNIGCILMAAGQAARFGENKLLYTWQGKTLVERALEAAPACLFARAVAVVSDVEVAGHATRAGYAAVLNPAPQRGQGLTIALGMREMGGMDAVLFCVADQPCLSRASVQRLLRVYRPGQIYALSYRGRRGNPVLFPSECFEALCRLAPDKTGKAVIARHLDRLVLVEAARAEELFDIDTREDAKRLRARDGADS